MVTSGAEALPQPHIFLCCCCCCAAFCWRHVVAVMGPETGGVAVVAITAADVANSLKFNSLKLFSVRDTAVAFSLGIAGIVLLQQWLKYCCCAGADAGVCCWTTTTAVAAAAVAEDVGSVSCC